MTDNKWRITGCCCRGGFEAVSAQLGIASECDHCINGQVWIRPSGHTFLYPGGPATGRASSKEYSLARPYTDPRHD